MLVSKRNYSKMDNLSQEEFEALGEKLFKLCADLRVHLVELRRLMEECERAQEVEAAQELKQTMESTRQSLAHFVDELVQLSEPEAAEDIRQFFLE